MTENSEKSIALHMLEKFTDDRHKMERYSAVAELCPIPVFIVAHDGMSAVYVNQSYREFTGSSLTEVQDMAWLSHIHPDDRSKCEKVWKQFLEDNVPRPSVRRYLVNGGVREGTMTAYRVENNGYVGFIVPVCSDHCHFMQVASPAGIPPAT